MTPHFTPAVADSSKVPTPEPRRSMASRITDAILSVLAVVRQIPASDIKVGDVTTVSRGEGQLPVTHRVVSVTPVGGGTYSVEMKGDANDSPDAQPYEVTEVKKVLWHAPGLAFVVAAVSQPKYMAGITVAASILVVWAFWPRKQQ